LSYVPEAAVISFKLQITQNLTLITKN